MGQLTQHLDKVVRGTVEETLNSLLDAEAYRLCQARRYERTDSRKDTRAGHYSRKMGTRVVGAFPDGESALMLVAARLRHIASTKWGTRRYMNMDRLQELEKSIA